MKASNINGVSDNAFGKILGRMNAKEYARQYAMTMREVNKAIKGLPEYAIIRINGRTKRILASRIPEYPDAQIVKRGLYNSQKVVDNIFSGDGYITV